MLTTQQKNPKLNKKAVRTARQCRDMSKVDYTCTVDYTTEKPYD